MIDFNHKKTLSEKINGYIDSALIRERLKEPPRDYLGGSILGRECERSLQFEYLHYEKDEGREFKGITLRTFDRGHWIESYALKCLCLGGFQIATEMSNGDQFGFSLMDGKIQGHIDGIIISGPEEFGPYPFLWENKGLAQKYYNSVKKHKLEKHSDTYHGQVQLYQGEMNLTNDALWTCVNPNTMDIYHERVKHFPFHHNQLVEKGKRIILACESGEFLPRISIDRNFYKCKMCSYTDTCFSIDT